MFKTGVITDEVSQELEPSIELAKRFRLDGLELRTVKDKGVFDFTPQDIAEIKAKTEEAGLSVCGISAPFYKCELTDESEIAESLRGLETCIRMAQTFHTKIIRGFTFWRRKPFEEVLEDILRRFEAPAAMLRGTASPWRLRPIPASTPPMHPSWRRSSRGWDPPRFKRSGIPAISCTRPERKCRYPDGYGRLRSYVAHVHLKDAVLNPKGEAVGCALAGGLWITRASFAPWGRMGMTDMW